MLLVPDTGFTEIADRVWVARHSWLDVNVTVVGGDRGVVVVDTLASARTAAAMVESLRGSVPGDVLAVVNTHHHFDHVLGNGTLLETWPDALLVAHETAAEETVPGYQRILEAYAAEPADPHGDEVRATTPVPATTTFSSSKVLDLGDRAIELIHPGPGHTSGDLVALVPDCGVLLAGDLLEQSPDRDGCPGFGLDCHPFEWPLTLDLVLQLLAPDARVVPGHGDLVDRAYAEEQRDQIAVVAETIRGLAGDGVRVEDALEAGTWPWPTAYLGDAVTRGYALLPNAAKRLPLA